MLFIQQHNSLYLLKTLRGIIWMQEKSWTDKIITFKFLNNKKKSIFVWERTFQQTLNKFTENDFVNYAVMIKWMIVDWSGIALCSFW